MGPLIDTLQECVSVCVHLPMVENEDTLKNCTFESRTHSEPRTSSVWGPLQMIAIHMAMHVGVWLKSPRLAMLNKVLGLIEKYWWVLGYQENY